MEDKEEIPKEWRKELTAMTDKELDDELQRPTGDWKMDVQRETLRRLLKG